jgi:acetate kinase
MPDALLVLNAGSSSLKFSVFRDDDSPALLLRGQIEGLSTEPRFAARDASNQVVAEQKWPDGTKLGYHEAIEFLFGWMRKGTLAEHRLRAAGHRIVHGGMRFTGPVLVDAEVLAGLEALVPLAPLHQPHNIAAIRATAQHAPELPQVACFDTSFHRTQPVLAQTFGLPYSFFDEGIRRYGFHGLSYEYIASILAHYDAKAAAGRTVVAHLGNGASLCALQNGQSAATTMGFTAIDGLIMGTRCGALDPGVMLYLMDQKRMSVPELEQLLYNQSGLLGLSGISSDMRTLLASDDPRAAAAIDLFVYRIGRELGSLAAVLGGIDALVFTGGIGEHAAPIRKRVCRDADWLGLVLEEGANEAGRARITRTESVVSAWVIPTDEELMIARHTMRVVEGEGPA